MKIIQSFWSKPSYKKKNIRLHDRNNGGWIDRKYNYFSWALSCLQFKKYYDDVELVTDEIGYEILIKKLKLPYTKIDVSLDKINHYHEDLWALGKIYAYSIQDSPFIHADGDVFIFKKFEDSFEKSPILAQNSEVGYTLYREIFGEIKANFAFIPEDILNYYHTFGEINGVNNGVVGGNAISFFKKYTEKAFEFIDQNTEHLSKINIGLFNIIFEQALLYSMAHRDNIPVDFYFDNINQGFDGICDVLGSSHERSYLHALGPYKTTITVPSQIEDLLRKSYPEYYYNIIRLLKTYQI
ncbi:MULTISPECIES: DUF6734 family protein [unclassified Chryseobacterium]|uniref:DUF6734 family protein n=1 Tax=unclassified Chryseobacterium TaxID=2593645 RepID=UPI0011585AFB|nr:DUF6734 family protein [Chryseobacterium sp. ON_d1]GEJ45766.1 hypothetical protein CRS_23740 [Chryseobacterium sp. ON_d1]